MLTCPVPERAYALLGQGRCLSALGKPEAEQPLREARELFTSMGYKPALAETDVLLGEGEAVSCNAGKRRRPELRSGSRRRVTRVHPANSHASGRNRGGFRIAAVRLSQVGGRMWPAGIVHRAFLRSGAKAERAVGRVALSMSSTSWRDERSQNRASQQELQSYGEESPRAMPATAPVEELPSARAQEREDMLEVGAELAAAPSVAG